jgi:hypothetical protein
MPLYFFCLTKSRISGYFQYPAGYLAGQIRYPAGYRISKRSDYPAGRLPVHPSLLISILFSLIFCEAWAQ